MLGLEINISPWAVVSLFHSLNDEGNDVIVIKAIFERYSSDSLYVII